MDFWRQVGRENGAKIDPRRHRKKDGKVDSIKMAKKSQQDVLTRRFPRGPGPWGGGRGRGRAFLSTVKSLVHSHPPTHIIGYGPLRPFRRRVSYKTKHRTTRHSMKKTFGSPNGSQQSIWRGGPRFDGRIRQHPVHHLLASKASGGGVPILMVV